MVATWNSSLVKWNDTDVAWDGSILATGPTATLQSVATMVAEARHIIRTPEATMQSVATMVAEASKIHHAECTMQVATTFGADADLHVGGVQSAEATLQTVATLVADGTKVKAGEATLQIAAYLTAQPQGSARHGEARLQVSAYLLADPDVGKPASGEWYIRGGGSFYPAPLNRRKRLVGHQGSGRRIG